MPEQLRMLRPFCYIGADKCGNYAAVWGADRNGHDGKSRWDEDFTVRFETESRKRLAYVDKAGKSAVDTAALAELKYNAALAWCRENLVMLEIGR